MEPEYTGKTAYVVVRYRTDRRYGGPEEGGWWYTDGEIDEVIGTDLREWVANDLCYRENTHPERAEDESYTVVAIPRYDVPEHLRGQMCHADVDLGPEDYVLRWDIPQYYEEGRPHYC